MGCVSEWNQITAPNKFYKLRETIAISTHNTQLHKENFDFDEQYRKHS